MANLSKTLLAHTGNYSGIYIFMYKCVECYQDDIQEATRLARYSKKENTWFPICDLCLADDLHTPPSVGIVLETQPFSVFLGFDESFIIGKDVNDMDSISDQAYPYRYIKIAWTLFLDSAKVEVGREVGC